MGGDTGDGIGPAVDIVSTSRGVFDNILIQLDLL